MRIVKLTTQRVVAQKRKNKHLKIGEMLIHRANNSIHTYEKKKYISDADEHFKKAMNLNTFIKKLTEDITEIEKQGEIRK